MVELEGANAVCVHLPRLIADHDDLQAVLRLELGNEVKRRRPVMSDAKKKRTRVRRAGAAIRYLLCTLTLALIAGLSSQFGYYPERCIGGTKVSVERIGPRGTFAEHRHGHSEKRLRLSEHKLAKLVTRQGVLLMKHHPAQIFFKGELALLVYLKYETVTLIHFGPVQIEVPGRPLARKIVPSIG